MKNACFISYSHSTDPHYASVITTFAEQLDNQLALPMPKREIFRDNDRLKPGYLFQPALAQALCESSCMVMLFTPGYFDEAHPFCALEYLAMQELEQQRAAHLDIRCDSRYGRTRSMAHAPCGLCSRRLRCQSG